MHTITLISYILAFVFALLAAAKVPARVEWLGCAIAALVFPLLIGAIASIPN